MTNTAALATAIGINRTVQKFIHEKTKGLWGGLWEPGKDGFEPLRTDIAIAKTQVIRDLTLQRTPCEATVDQLEEAEQAALESLTTFSGTGAKASSVAVREILEALLDIGSVARGSYPVHNGLFQGAVRAIADDRARATSALIAGMAPLYCC